jgi:predicted aspartyl protease
MNQAKKFLSCILLILGISSCSFVGGNSYSSLREKSGLASSSFNKEQAFRFDLHIITIPVEINGKTYEFIFDTGAGNTIVSRQVAQELGLETKTSIHTRDSKNNKQMMDVTLIDTISIAGVNFSNISANIVDWPDFSAVECLGKDGLIGNNLIRHCNWIVDYDKKVLKLTDSDLETTEMEHITQMFYASARPKFDLLLDSTLLKSVLLDLGSGGGLDLGRNLVKNHKINIQTYPNLKKIDGTTQGLFGRSLDSTIIIQANSISVDGFTLYKPIVDIESKSGAKVGNRFLKHSKLYLDYTYGTIGFSPYKDTSYYEKPMNYGLAPALHKNGLYVGSILVNSAAYKQGIRQGDQIIKLNEKSASDFSEYCEFLSYINKLSKGNSALKLIFASNPDKVVSLEKSSIWQD